MPSNRSSAGWGAALSALDRVSPGPGIRSFAVGTPADADLAGLEAGLDIRRSGHAGGPRKSLAMGDLMIRLVDRNAPASG